MSKVTQVHCDACAAVIVAHNEEGGTPMGCVAVERLSFKINGRSGVVVLTETDYCCITCLQDHIMQCVANLETNQ